MIKTRGLESHNRVEQAKKSDEEVCWHFPKLTRTSIELDKLREELYRFV